MRPSRPNSLRRKNGFALLITITLLAFLVLLLVSLASLTRVETQVASNNQQLAQARQNALMALNIALGELQKYTGPDQRTTARSDMDATLANTTVASGRWLGAYGNGGVADYTMIPSAITTAMAPPVSDSKGSQAKLLNWLVSGNEDTAFDPAVNVGTEGNIATPPTGFRFSPAGAVGGLSSSTTALTDTLTVADKAAAAQPARLLVGANTVGNSPTDFVVAPLRDITALAPGMGTTPVPTGRYAWWVGDEGAKARVNLPIAAGADLANAFVSAQRPAVELVDATNPSDATTLTTAAMLDPTGALSRYDPSSALLKKLLSTSQLPQLSAAAANALGTVAKFRYHDLSVWSSSVLSDTYAGGLKKDLSAVLASGASSPADTDFIFPPETNTGSQSNHLGVATWGQLRSFANTTTSSAGILPRAPGIGVSSQAAFSTAPVPTDVGIYPVMSYAAIGFRYIAPDGDAVNNRIGLAAVPIVVLWNPYTVPIRGRDDSGNPVYYEVGIRKAYASRIQLQGRAATTGAIGSYTWTPADILPITTGGSTANYADLGRAGTNPYIRFIIESPAGGIPAGQSLIFTLKTNGKDYSEAAGNILTNGMNDNYYVILPGIATITPALGAGAYYRVGVNSSPNSSSPNNSRTVFTYTIPPTMWNVGTNDGNFGGAGNGWHEAYLGEVSSAPNFPNGSFPWKNVGGFPTQKLYQSFTLLSAPGVATPPYGTQGIGYAVSWGSSGLVQNEGTLSTDMTMVTPAWRMTSRALFAQPSPSNANLEIGRGRWIMQANIRAFMMATGGASIAGRPSQNSWPFDLSSPDDLHAPSGISLSNATPNETTLFEFRPDTMPLLSIGQLQHANLGWLSGMPSYAIGNSNGVGLIQYDFPLDTSQSPARLNTATITATVPQRLVRIYTMNGSEPGNKVTAYYDHSWLLNRAIWDRYFVSTIPHAGTGKTALPSPDSNSTGIPEVLANPLHTLRVPTTDPDLRDADKAAGKLMLAGGFNVNSASEQAWRAILGSSNRLNYNPATTGSAWSKITFSRFSKPTTNDTTNPWLGYRQLTEVQIAQFAKSIVAEIRARGPFISLADFVNRRLYTSNSTIQAGDTRIKGPFQAALDANTTGAGAINSVDAGSPLNVFATTEPSYKVINAYRGLPNDAFGTGTHNPAAPTPPYGTSGAGVPQFLTQADVLSSIGSQLTARSDTFVIRTYGEVLDPVNSTSSAPVITGRAWCEATVQRVPEFVNDSMPAETNLRTAVTSPAKTTNVTFGRKYKITSFRWLAPSDI